MAGLPPAVIELVHAGARALRDGQPQRAEPLLLRAGAQAPSHPEPLRYLAILQLHTRRAPMAMQTLQRALTLTPDDALLHCDLGTVQSACGDIDTALASWHRACKLEPAQPMPWFNLGRNLQQLGRTDEAIAALREAITHAPDMLPAKILLGDALVHAGRFDEAVSQYRDALRLQPACGDAWRGLSNIKTRALDTDDARMLETQLQRRDIADSDRVAIGHALGKLHEDQGRHADAHAAFIAANALQKRLTPWSRQAFEQFVARALTATEALPAPIDADLGRQVIFIVGQPRSGSTLFEQVLAAHPDVEGASELPYLGIVIQQESIRRGVAYPQWVPQATAADWHRLGRDYLARTARWRAHKPRFTDKLPENWKHAGILRAMLPGASVIETRRDPLETAWSCFKQQFYSQPHFGNDLGDIAAHIQGSERAMDVFRGRAPARIHLHRYEDLLADPESRIRALLDDCGLRFDPACLTSHEARRNVRTASAAQVRQPLRHDTARASAYGALLDPLRAALEQSR
ncbi:sulfotransferase [Thermomonas carbonis]|uniref:Sulfotransferase n=2 Tax=Thermomonas carbonis TaxID=1463158 RepID=A0A7G9SUT5_9GAMM|nr:sulfotransferase [Thermomonas carbonis]